MAKDFGELALVLGDAHVPGRAPKIPAKLKRMLVPNKMQHVLCTGNMGSRELYDELRALAPTQHFVCGDDDDDADGVDDYDDNSDDGDGDHDDDCGEDEV